MSLTCVSARVIRMQQIENSRKARGMGVVVCDMFSLPNVHYLKPSECVPVLILKPEGNLYIKIYTLQELLCFIF